MEARERRHLGESTFRDVMQVEPPEVRTVVEAKSLDLEFAELWNRPVLSRLDRRWITLASLVCLGDETSLRAHLYGALKSGDISLDELEEGMFHCALYRGFPLASFGQRALSDVAEELNLTPSDQLDLEPVDWASESDRLDTGEEKFLSVMASRAGRSPGDFKHVYSHYGVLQTVFAELWPRPVLNQRIQRLITLACVGLSVAPLPVTMHCRVAMETGDLSYQEMGEFTLHFCFYAGWPCASQMSTATDQAFIELEQLAANDQMRRDVAAAHSAVGPDYSLDGYRKL